MLKKLKRLFGFKVAEKSLEERLFATILLPSVSRDDIRWHYGK